MSDQWAWWRAALKGDNPDWERGNPPSGYFRSAKGECCAIWRDENGTLQAWRSGGKYTPPAGDVDKIEEFFATTCRDNRARPISAAEYKAFMEAGKWPDQVDEAPATIGDNSGAVASDLDAARAAVDDLFEQYRDWKREIGGKVTTKENADKAANFGDRFGKFEKRADDLRKVEKQPHMDAATAVDNAWRPIITTAKDAKTEAKNLLTRYLKEEQRKRDEAAAAERERLRKEAEAAREKGFVEPEPVKEPEPQRVHAGTQGRVASLRTYKSAVITDLKAAAAFFAEMDQPPPDFVKAITAAAFKVMSAGMKVPGAEIKEEQRTA